MPRRSDDGAAFTALNALHAEGWDYRVELTATQSGVRARLTLTLGTNCAIESAATLGGALTRCAKELRIEDHPAVRAAAQRADTIPEAALAMARGTG